MKKAKKKSLKPKKEKAMQGADTGAAAETTNEDPVFKNETKDGTGLDVEVPDVPKTKIPSGRKAAKGNLFTEAQAEHDREKAKREQDTQIGLLIGQKNLVRLRAFGFDVVHAATIVPGSAHMGIAK